MLPGRRFKYRVPAGEWHSCFGRLLVLRRWPQGKGSALFLADARKKQTKQTNKQMRGRFDYKLSKLAFGSRQQSSTHPTHSQCAPATKRSASRKPRVRTSLQYSWRLGACSSNYCCSLSQQSARSCLSPFFSRARRAPFSP
ncbi:unnamed protein product [Laminaria digitata]